ncbi:hypothetical protein EU803_15765 [Loktanella sp. IMCC34160]|uniref:hypothetical protein n=1 Tax=Loktanella sp. IMCC34160 TaxID=2510646 RepID=UPI00101D0EBB|nr:hypothetical protein [Loktanella sp. IMCC34160]RYG90068.1 hypothetical protein EU803_15765 [Loktanella sp. IMCC34160]
MNARADSKRSPVAGITLLELLLALAVMGMIGVALASSYSTTGQVWRRLGSGGAEVDQALARADLWAAVEAMPEVGPRLPIAEVFGAGTDGFWMPDAEGAVTRIALQDGQLLMEAGGLLRALRGDVGQLRIAYYGRKTVRSPEGWSNDWDGGTILPRLILIETWDSAGIAHPPLALRPALRVRQSVISASSPLPPG